MERIQRTSFSDLVLDVGGKPRELFQGKPPQFSGDGNPKVQNPIQSALSRIRSKVLEVEGEDSYHYANPTSQMDDIGN